MTERVYKYPMPLKDWVTLLLPKGAKPLHVDMQHDALCLWARADLDAAPEHRHFRIAGTGHDLGSNVGQHVGTFRLNSLVFHVFEAVE